MSQVSTFTSSGTPSRLPALFISHGSPMLALVDSPAHKFLQELGKSLPRPAAIVVVSAHWESIGGAAVSLAQQPATIHDFGGFPRTLFDIQYPAPGAPQVGEHAAALLEEAGFAVSRSTTRGLDHGAWVPLYLMYPAADIPTLQVSVIRGATAAQHERLGWALAPLRDQGVLVIGSGSLTHNLYEFRGQEIDEPAQEWVTKFSDWMAEKLQNGDRDALLDYRQQAPYATRNHPTDEHLMPLYAAMGAGGAGAKVERLHSSNEYGILAMDAYAFG
ncbi:4,5-DOPA dioxygenase extradiol [Paucimonas lemoignei]|uniref:4,5-DOPA dioxygenase extradiol n=1 Tax=Paucimonas lemoignei TaxID=29443 RepID=A0A4R3I3E5_PAULE|nr:class III extradiol ring-cleavage dioxygenase [Paucimonas lemoignei]TCS38439.1 4,5-DOPA dioxygenase extradiol [Paucimonas lemoignei]